MASIDLDFLLELSSSSILITISLFRKNVLCIYAVVRSALFMTLFAYIGLLSSNVILAYHWLSGLAPHPWVEFMKHSVPNLID